ncbi:neurochondrin [Amblyomma americanum]
MSSLERDEIRQGRLLKSTCKALRKSTSDVEKLAALLVLTKAVDAASLQLDDKRKLLDAISVPFVVRLLQAEEDAFRALGADIVCAFAVDADLCEPLRPALDALVAALGDLGTATGVDCASRLAVHEPGCRALVQSGLLSALVELTPPELGALLTSLAMNLPDGDELISAVRACTARAAAGRLNADAKRGLFALLASMAERRGLGSLDTAATALAAVELEMQLYGAQGGTPPDAVLVAHSCVLLEAAVDEAVTGGKLPASAARVPGVLIAFLDEAFQSPCEGHGQAIMLPLCRLLCRWLADDSTSMRPEVAKVLGPLLELASSEEAILPLAIPALCHLTADDTLRPIVLKSPVLDKLHLYLTQWTAPFQQLETCFGIFLNLAVLDAKALDSFPHLLELCVQKAVVEADCPTLLKANVSLLGLFLLRSRLRRSQVVSDTPNLRTFVETCFLLFGSSPTLSEADVDEWNELRSLGRQLLADVLPALEL